MSPDPPWKITAEVSEKSKLSRKFGSFLVRGLCIATEQCSLLCVSAVVLFFCGSDQMEVDEQDREPVENGEKVGARERERKKTKRE